MTREDVASRQHSTFQPACNGSRPRYKGTKGLPLPNSGRQVKETLSKVQTWPCHRTALCDNRRGQDLKLKFIIMFMIIRSYVLKAVTVPAGRV